MLCFKMFWKITKRFTYSAFYVRYYGKDVSVRVRFAPSPTGFLHLGGLRTALYNYLFARSKNGAFILRIEDTDQSRIIPNAIEKLQDDLIWAGIIPDEDPIRGGPSGPYIQSKRLELYAEQIKILLDNKSAYKCFCSQYRLDLLRREAVMARQIPKYDNRCRDLTDDEIQENLRKNVPHCVRFKIVPTPDPFNDLVMGWKGYDISKNEGDPVIFKSDGYPTYHFANVVDDHFMQITHVLRGIEWQISTPKHLLLYKAFGWEPPQFGHLPLILNSDGSKLSKRQHDITVEYYRNNGILPLALINYITAAGGGFIRDQGEQKCYSYKELIEQFEVSKINIHSSKLRPEQLLEFNKLEISNLLECEKNHKFLVDKVIQIINQSFPERVNNGSLCLDHKYVLIILMWAKNRISTLGDLVSKDLKFLWVKPNVANSLEELKHLESIKKFSESLENIDANNFSKDSIKPCLQNFTTENNIPFPEFMRTLRSLLSGLKDGPSVVEMMEILGKDVTLDRLRVTHVNN